MRKVATLCMGLLAWASLSFAKPAGPLPYVGPETIGSASGLEVKRQARTFDYNGSEVEHSSNVFSAFGLKYFSSAYGGWSLFASNQGGYKLKDSDVESTDEMIGLGTGFFGKYEYVYSETIRLVPTISWDIIYEQFKEDQVTWAALTRDASASLAVSFQVSRVIKPYVAVDFGQGWGDLTYKNDEIEFDGALQSSSATTLHFGAVFEWEKLTMGLVAFTGNSTGIALSFFSTPRNRVDQESQQSQQESEI